MVPESTDFRKDCRSRGAPDTRGTPIIFYSALSDSPIGLVIVRKASLAQMLRLLPEVFDGSYISSPLLEYIQAKEFSLIPEVDKTINVDNELLDRSPIQVTIIPHVFRVFI